jgi:hypothetical protein
MWLSIATRKIVGGGGQYAFARIPLGTEVRKCGIYSILCATREAELRFSFTASLFSFFFLLSFQNLQNQKNAWRPQNSKSGRQAFSISLTID